MSGFFGEGVIARGTLLGNLLAKGGFFGPIFRPTPVLAGFVITTGLGVPSGFSFPFIGWDGMNGVVGPGTTGILVSGSTSVFAAGAQFSFGDAQAGGFPPGGIPPLFTVSSGSLYLQNQFTSVTINGHTYVTAAADFFDNNGGCGPTIWEWNVAAGLANGTNYAPVFT